MICTFQQVLLA